jgi:hypothetical protein
MSIIKEIESNSSEEDKPALRWLLEQYPRSSTWSFIATCSHQSHGETGAWRRIWKPTKEGRILYLSSLVDYPTRHKWAYPDGTPKGEERLSQADEILVLRRELLDAVKERDEARIRVCELCARMGGVYRRVDGKTVECTTPESVAEVCGWGYLYNEQETKEDR